MPAAERLPALSSVLEAAARGEDPSEPLPRLAVLFVSTQLKVGGDRARARRGVLLRRLAQPLLWAARAAWLSSVSPLRLGRLSAAPPPPKAAVDVPKLLHILTRAPHAAPLNLITKFSGFL